MDFPDLSQNATQPKSQTTKTQNSRIQTFPRLQTIKNTFIKELNAEIEIEKEKVRFQASQ